MTTSAALIRLHRLDRLRDRGTSAAAGSPGTPVGSAGTIVRPAAPMRSEDVASGPSLAQAALVSPRAVARDTGRAEHLARALGGHVVGCGSGTVTIIERASRLPADLGRLRELPDPVDPSLPIICLDVETTGLGTAAGTMPFLIALGRWREDQFIVRQLMLPDHPDEPALLDVLEQHLPRDALLVTYNGRTFDWPLITSRFRLHGRPPPAHAAHLDLLHLARQVWKHRLPDARLASVEAAIAGVHRLGDLPGALIPQRYFGWLRTGRAEPLIDVLDHNRQDVVSLALLLRVLAQGLLPERQGAVVAQPAHPWDLAGLGRVYGRRGRPDEALACYEAALERFTAPWLERELQARVSADRARALARLGRPAEAASAWEAVAMEGGPLAAIAWIQVAKWHEHDQRDAPAALQAARRAEALAERSRFLGDPYRLVERDLARRMPRLVRLARRGTLSASAA